jgi:FkbM family methyltransferase
VIVGTPLESVARWALRRPLPPTPWWAALDAEYDEQTREVMRRVLRADSNGVDIGAHRGAFLGDMIKLAPNGTHHAFEPLPALAAELRANFPTAPIHELALGARNGTTKYCWFVDDPAWSGLKRDRWERNHADEPAPREEWIDIAVARLDDVLPEDLPIRFMKIDANGGEADIFRGAIRTLCTWRPFIAFEHGESASYYGESNEGVYDLLSDIGFRITTLDGWLSGRASLSRDEFLYACQHTDFFWLAHP